MYSKFHLLPMFFLMIALPALGESFTGKCVAVIDGDTIQVMHERIAEKVRINNVDAPELRQDFGDEAKKSTAEICQDKILKIEIKTYDVNGRTIADVFLPDGSSLAEGLLRRGIAWCQPGISTSRLQILEENARTAKIGLWARLSPEPPWCWQKKAETAPPAQNGTFEPPIQSFSYEKIEKEPNPVKEFFNSLTYYAPRWEELQENPYWASWIEKENFASRFETAKKNLDSNAMSQIYNSFAEWLRPIEFFDALDEAVPNWESLQSTMLWKQWIEDSARYKLFTAARDSYDANTMIALFSEFDQLRETILIETSKPLPPPPASDPPEYLHAPWNQTLRHYYMRHNLSPIPSVDNTNRTTYLNFRDSDGNYSNGTATTYGNTTYLNFRDSDGNYSNGTASTHGNTTYLNFRDSDGNYSNGTATTYP